MSKALDLIKKGDELLLFKSGTRANPADFRNGKNVILLHGFTAHGDYLNTLASYMETLELRVFVYNYNSYKGIDRAAEALVNILQGIDVISDGSIESNKVMLVCHSMGGLVGRASCCLFDGGSYIKKIVTIGTPHDGTLAGSAWLEHLVRFGESLSGAGVLRGYSRDCRSALQILAKDKIKDNEKLLHRLKMTNNRLTGIDMFSISGGKRYLIFGKNAVLNRLANVYLQKHLNHEENDGLVPEASSDWSANCDISDRNCQPGHLGYYPEFPDLNHSFLIENQAIVLSIVKFLHQSRAKQNEDAN